MNPPESFNELIGQTVVVDTDTHLVYIGKLERIGADSIVLSEVDAHSQYDTHSSREIYLMEASKFGARANRKETILLLSRVVSVSRLDDVLDY